MNDGAQNDGHPASPGVAIVVPASRAGRGATGARGAVTGSSAAAKADAGVPMAELTAPMNDALISDTTRATDPDAVASLRRWLADVPAAGFAWAQRAMAGRPDRLAALAALSVPAVVLHGTDDSFMGPETQTPMADALGVTVTTLPGAGHLLPLEAADAVAAALRGLVTQAQAPE